MKIYSYKAMLNETGVPYVKKEVAFNVDGRKTFSNAELIADFVHREIGLQDCAEEYLYVLCLDSKLHLTGCFECSHGTVNSTLISPREICQKSLLLGACSIVLVHNHPSGDPTPSALDLTGTEKMINAGNLIDIPCIDHVIIGRSNWLSLRSYGYLEGKW